jgi:hypothetical protein
MGNMLKGAADFTVPYHITLPLSRDSTAALSLSFFNILAISPLTILKDMLKVRVIKEKGSI